MTLHILAMSDSPRVSRRSERRFARRSSSGNQLTGCAPAFQFGRRISVHVPGNSAASAATGRARIGAVTAETVSGRNEPPLRSAASERADRVSVGAVSSVVSRDRAASGSGVAAVVTSDASSDRRLEDFVSVPTHLVEGLVGSLDRFSSQAIEPRKHSVFRLASEVSNFRDRTVILSERVIQKDSGPIPVTELGFSDELNPSGLDSVDVDSLPNDERVGVLGQDVGRGRSAVDTGLGQPPCDHGGHVVVVERTAARRRADMGQRWRGRVPRGAESCRR